MRRNLNFLNLGTHACTHSHLHLHKGLPALDEFNMPSSWSCGVEYFVILNWSQRVVPLRPKQYLVCRPKHMSWYPNKGIPTEPSIFFLSVCAWGSPTIKWPCAAFWLCGKSVWKCFFYSFLFQLETQVHRMCEINWYLEEGMFRCTFVAEPISTSTLQIIFLLSVWVINSPKTMKETKAR